jgi:hypothetical protein
MLQNHNSPDIINVQNLDFVFGDHMLTLSMNVGPCHHGMARPQVADGGTASYMEGSCEYGSLSPRHGASLGCGWRNGLIYGG